MTAYEIPLVTEAGVVIERRVVVADADVPVSALTAQAARRARVLTLRLRLRAALRARTYPPLVAPAQPGLFARPPGGGAPERPQRSLTSEVVSVGPPRLLVRFVVGASGRPPESGA